MNRCSFTGGDKTVLYFPDNNRHMFDDVSLYDECECELADGEETICLRFQIIRDAILGDSRWVYGAVLGTDEYYEIYFKLRENPEDDSVTVWKTAPPIPF